MSLPGPAPARDRTVALVLFGVLQIFLGAGCALLVPATLALVVFGDELFPGATLPDLRSTIPGLSLYAVLAFVFVALGVGSIRARRWAVTLSLTVAWIWLLTGVLCLGVLVLAWTALSATLGIDAGGGLVTAVTSVVVLGVSTVLYVALPAALVLFYRSPHVRATSERRWPEPDWSDRCPSAVLALALSHALLAYSFVLLAPYDWAVPFFGVVVTGWTSAAVIVASVAVNLWIAWAMYRLRPVSLWAGVAVIVAMSVSTVITFARVDPLDYYARADLPPEQIEMVRSTGLATPAVVDLVTVVFALAYVAYALSVRKSFAATRSTSPGKRT